MVLKSRKVIQIVIGLLIFVLGVLVGYRYIPNGSLPFVSQAATTPLSRLLGQDNQSAPFTTQQVTGTDVPGELTTVEFDQFWEVWQLLEREYINPTEIDRQQMVYGAIQGMTASLGDPYTVYLPPKEDQRTEEELAGAFYGVGIELGYIDGVLAVVAPLNGMPAQQAGVQAGDLILHVTDETKGIDEDSADWSLDEAVTNIRGRAGTSVTLTLARPDDGNRIFDVTITREEIVIPTVELEFVEHNGETAAHIQLSRFGERTEEEWNQAIAEITNRNPDVVLLDMRNNPGGFFDGAVDVVSEFVDSGVVATQRGRFSSRDFRTQGRARLANAELVVLVNRGSASASEIVAGALRDLREAQLVGENTFGKGTVQDRRQLEEGGIHITVAEWLLPGGSSINEEGIPVDVEVRDDLETEQDEVVLRAIELD